jgi:hypothetical protein
MIHAALAARIGRRYYNVAKFFAILSIAAGFIAAVCWLLSALVRLIDIGPGQDALDKVTTLSNDLQRMARWNFWAAASTGAAVAFQVLARLVN